MRYTYGTGDTAVTRLRTVSDVFDPYSSAFVRKHAPEGISCAVDLGCGPGFSTTMLAMAARAKRTFGIDSSETFLSSAKASFGYDFYHYDVTLTPLPVKADLIYCRFLLSHLADPVELIDDWLRELAPGGLLLLEEVEDIRTDVEVFQRYLEVNTELVASQNARLFVGEEIAAGNYSHAALVNEPVYVPVSVTSAAAMFYPNTVSIWEEEESVLNRLSPDERVDIASALRHLAESSPEADTVQWTMRRMVFPRAC